MTDAELIARLREYREINEGSTGVSYDPIPECLAAADRIEALIAERDYLATSVDKAVARMYAAEDKLAKAVEALEYYAVEAMPWDADDSLIARTALAKIKGERAMSDSSWEIEAQKRINQLAVLVDFARRAERYAEDIGNKFLAEKARAVLAEIKGESHE